MKRGDRGLNDETVRGLNEENVLGQNEEVVWENGQEAEELTMSGIAEPDIRSRKFRIAVFASGSGSNFQAIVDAVRRGDLDAEVALLVCDKPKARVVERAAAAGVTACTFLPKEYESREAYEAEIVELLQEHEIDLIVLAGYMRLITKVLLRPYEGRIINIHPSLLPAFPGVDGIGDAYRYGVRVTGVTVHYVDDGMDSGPIIAQEPVRIDPEDSLEAVADSIHAVEHELYPRVIRWISEGRVRLEGRKVVYSCERSCE